MKSGQIIKVISILCFALLAFILIVLRNNPATGYESSIYTGTPPIVWGVIIFSIICGTGIILHQIYTRKEEKSNLWVIGLVLMIFSLTILFSAHALRAYYFYGRGDGLTHLGMVRDIIFTGHAAGRNIYPALHIFVAQLSFIPDISLTRLFGYIPAFFAVLFTVFMYFFARFILPHKGQAILATVAGTFVLTEGANGPVFTSPNSQANMLVPLVFFLCFISLAKSTLRLKIPFGLLVLIMIFLFPVFHPVPAFAILLMMLTLWLPAKIYNIWAKKSAQHVPNIYRFITLPVLLLFIWSIAWISSFFIWESAIRNIYTIATEGGANQFGALRDTIDYATGYGYSVWEQFFIRTAATQVFFILTLISIPILLKKMSHSKNLVKLFSLYGPLTAYALAAIIFFGFNIQFGPGRLLIYTLIIGAVFIGFVFYEVMEKTRNALGKVYLPRLGLLAMALIFVVLSVNGVFSSHYSRYTKTPSTLVTSAEIRGAEWFFNDKDTHIDFISLTISPRRFADALLRPEEKKTRVDILKGEYSLIPWHFNYDTRRLLGESYVKDTYMVVSDCDRIQYVEVYPETAEFRFYAADFDRLEDDSSLDRLYTNGGFEVWQIHPIAAYSPIPEMGR